jgi:hypothetical protein
VREDL